MSTALVINIFSSPDIKKEYENVDELLMFLKESCWLQEGIKNTAGDPEDLESAFFAKATADIPDASNIPNDLLQSKSHLKQLVFYLFERRFGWSEHDTLDESSKKLQEPSFRPNVSNSSPHHRFRSGTLHISEESRIKKMLNTKLDELIALLVVTFRHSNKFLINITSLYFESLLKTMAHSSLSVKCNKCNN